MLERHKWFSDQENFVTLWRGILEEEFIYLDGEGQVAMPLEILLVSGCFFSPRDEADKNLFFVIQLSICLCECLVCK